MAQTLTALTLILLIGLVLIRVALLNKQGVRAIHFGQIDRKDFLIPPFVLVYFYQVFAGAFSPPALSEQRFFESGILSWAGAGLCLIALVLFRLSLAAFGTSFRIGIDQDQPDRLVTGGVFALSRNPIYLAFWLVLLGQFLVFPNWILLLYLGGASWLFHRQVLLEEDFLEGHYGQAFRDYQARVRRYL